VTSLTASELAEFWGVPDSDTSEEHITPELVHAVETTLGYALPADYVRLLQVQNGGSPKRTCFPTSTRTCWAEDHVAVSCISGLGGRRGIASPTMGSPHFIESWGYPKLGIVFAESPTAGHDAFMLDYSSCGPRGEPTVIHVGVLMGYEPDITFLAADFATFIRGLVDESRYDRSAETKLLDLERARTGRFSSKLRQIAMGPLAPAGVDRALRSLLEAIVQEKGTFSLHWDDQSQLVYDALFVLYTRVHGAVSRAGYLREYPQLLVFCDDGEFHSSGYAPGFVEDWFDARLEWGLFDDAAGRYQFTSSAAIAVLAALLAYNRPPG
jgi:hypothetical protein